ncbi:unnamed protein product [marine sediment metagenome]|uniref:Uncharacterized protein n=1 Tax=marine sediment metagenome TaxID=412755 RepID=X0SGZ5_9ZZZZ
MSKWVDADACYVGWIIDGKLISTWDDDSSGYTPHTPFAVRHPEKVRLTKSFVKKRKGEHSDDHGKRIQDELFGRGYLRGTRAFYRQDILHFTVGTLGPPAIKALQDFVLNNAMPYKKIMVSGYFNDEFVEMSVDEFLTEKPARVYRQRGIGSFTFYENH